MVLRTQFSSGPEHNHLVNSDFVDSLGWFEGRLYQGGGWICVVNSTQV